MEKVIRKFYLVLAAVLILLPVSCSKDEYRTPHPDKGVISVSVDYPQGAEEGDYTVEVDGKPLDEGDRQTLTLRLSFLNGNPQDITIESDLTEQLVGFNLGMETVILTGELHTPTEAGVEAGIMDWEKIDGGGVDAEM